MDFLWRYPTPGVGNSLAVVTTRGQKAEENEQADL
jgi:hypothetical protein